MNSKFIFTKDAQKSFLSLEKELQKRLLSKLKKLKEHEDVFSILVNLKNFSPATHRLRIGNYRLILMYKGLEIDSLLEQKSHIFFVLDIGHRRDIYK